MPIFAGASRRPVISPGFRFFLETGQLPEHLAPEEEWWNVFLAAANDDTIRHLWETVREEVLATWIAEAPGTRPWGWWRFDAPRWRQEHIPSRCQRIAGVSEICAEPRRCVGGIGTPAYEPLNVWPAFDRGIPLEWVSTFDVTYYNGRARDIHGSPIGTEYHEGYFPYDAIDPEHPPRFESEAAYLDRHGLLTAEERRRLPVDAFALETVREEEEGSDDAA